MSHPNRVFSIDEIYESVWEEPSFNSDNTVSVHIRKIREKIELDPKKPKYLKVVWGVGYKIEQQMVATYYGDITSDGHCFNKPNVIAFVQ